MSISSLPLVSYQVKVGKSLADTVRALHSRGSYPYANDHKFPYGSGGGQGP